MMTVTHNAKPIDIVTAHLSQNFSHLVGTSATVKNVLQLSETRAGRTPCCLLWCPEGEMRSIREAIRSAHEAAYIVPCISAEDYRRTLESAGESLYDAAIVAQHAQIPNLVSLVRETSQRIPMLPILIIADDATPAEYYESGACPLFQALSIRQFSRHGFGGPSISVPSVKVIRQNEALERYARSFESSRRQATDT